MTVRNAGHRRSLDAATARVNLASDTRYAQVVEQHRMAMLAHFEHDRLPPQLQA